MRIQRVHAQGLQAPRGELDLALEAGYNALVARDPSQLAALAVLVRGLLQPDCWLGDFSRWIEPGADAPRADLALGRGSDGYRHIIDFARGRQVLAAFDVEAGSYQRVAGDRDEVTRCLEAVGIPSSDPFCRLYGLDRYGFEVRIVHASSGRRVSASDQLRKYQVDQ